MDKSLKLKYQELERVLISKQPIAIAFSGGTDSTLLLEIASRTIGKDRVLAITATTDYIPDWEIEEAKAFCQERKINHQVIQLEIPGTITNNPPDRCYHCKTAIFKQLREHAKQNGFPNMADGTNADDCKDYRPGMKALEELQVISPLKESGITKNEIRELSSKFNLPTANKPAYACLLTRLPYNTKIRKEDLERIDKAERKLHEAGYRGSRVRAHGSLARIEVSPKSDISHLVNNPGLEKLIKALKNLGYDYICLDLEGYRTGSFNQTLPENEPG